MLRKTGYHGWPFQMQAPHTHPLSTSSLLPNMDSHIQQAAHAILKATGKWKER